MTGYPTCLIQPIVLSSEVLTDERMIGARHKQANAVQTEVQLKGVRLAAKMVNCNQEARSCPKHSEHR